MRHWFSVSAMAAGLALWASAGMAQSGDPDRIDRQLALGHAAALENAWSSVAERIGVTAADDLWDDEWDGLSDPAASDWWLDSWSERGLSARYCDGVLAVYADRDELKGVGQVAPVAYGNERSGLHLVTRNSRLYTGAHGRGDGSMPACMPILSTTTDRVALVSVVDDPQTTPVGLRWEEEERTASCPVASDTGTLTERRRIPVQVTAVTNCPAATPNCNDLRAFVTGAPAWPADCATRETMLSATPPTLPANAACTDWFRWRSTCRVTYAAAPPAADIPDSVVTWEAGPEHTWTESCSCSSGETGTCTENWAQNTEWRVFVLRPGVPELRRRQPARMNGQPRLVSTNRNCTFVPVYVDTDGDGETDGIDTDGDGDADASASSSDGSPGSSAGIGEVGGMGGFHGEQGFSPGQSNSDSADEGSNGDSVSGDGSGTDGAGVP